MKNSKQNIPFDKIAVKVSLLNIICNICLAVIKLLAGILLVSGAMVSDGINSLSDVLSSIIVIIGAKMSVKKSDKNHPYGHERFECVTAVILSCALVVTAFFIGHEAIEMLTTKSYLNVEVPGVLAFIVIIFSIILKEIMFWFTRGFARRYDSSSLMGVAWDNRCDVLSSSCVLISIIGINFGVPILEVFAQLIICIFILRSAYGIFSDAIKKC